MYTYAYPLKGGIWVYHMCTCTYISCIASYDVAYVLMG